MIKKFSMTSIAAMAVMAALVTTPALATQSETSSQAQKMATASSEGNMHPEYAKSIARMAYIWGYPMVNMMNRKIALSAAPEPSRLGDVLPISPTGQIAMLYDYVDPGQNFIACPNQDVVYGLGFFSLDEQPVIVQVPDIGDRFWVYAFYDARTDQVGLLGKQYGSKPGFYLLVGPNWQGEVPAGINEVIKSPTALANAIPRLFMDDTDADRAAIQPILNQIVVYPLSEYDGKMKSKDWKNIPVIPNPNSGGGETKWVVPEKYFDQLGEVLKTVAPLPGEEALYGQMTALLAAAEKDPEIKKAITEAVIDLDKTLIKDFLQWEYNGKPAGNGWNRSVNNANWGVDYINRTGTARSNMFDNRPNETQYFYIDGSSDGKRLHGKNSYAITFPAGELPPVHGFWSMTLYNEHHFFYPNDLKRYSLGTKNKGLKKNADGSLTLYTGTKSPGADKESNWIPAPNGAFSLYIRAYWGKQAIIDGSWKPPVIKRMQ